MKDYDSFAKYIIKHVGGKDNIVDLAHCMTRLRIQLREEEKVEENEIRDHPNVIGTAHGGGRFQIIIGNSVGNVYDAVIRQIGEKKGKKKVPEQKDVVTRFIGTITEIITPILGVLIAVGLIKGLLTLLSAIGIAPTNSGTYLFLNAAGDCLFYFFPIILGYTSAETFGLNKFVGMLLGCILVYPNITADFTSGEAVFSILQGTPFHLEASKTLFGIPICFPENGYSSTIIPIILMTYFSSKIERFLKRIIPDIIGFAIVPVITLLFCSAAGVLLIGPVTNILSNIILWMTESLYILSPIIATIVIAMIYQPLVIFGLHWPLITLAMQNIGTLGYDYLWPMMYTASFAQTAVVMAVGLKTRNKKEKTAAVPAVISGLMCIIEPAIYGYTLPVKRRFLISCVSAAAGGVIITATNSTIVGLANGVLGFPVFIKPNGDMSGMFIAIGACLLTMGLAFAATILTYQENNKEEFDRTMEILSPAKGLQRSLTEVEDKTFASEILGKTVAISPEEGKIYAPCDAVVESVFSTGHAIGLRDTSGKEILIHVGIDTVQLNGKYFQMKVQKDDVVTQGDLLLEFDIEGVKKAGYCPDVFVVFSNSADYKEVKKENKKEIEYLEPLMVVQQEVQN